MMLYHCIGDVAQLKDGVLRCRALARDTKPSVRKDEAMARHQLLLDRYKIWRESGAHGYNRQMLLLEEDLCVFLHDMLKNAVMKSDAPSYERTVLACDMGAQEAFPPAHGERALISDESSMRVVPLQIDLHTALRRVYAQRQQLVAVKEAMRLARLEAEVVGFDIPNEIKYPLYSYEPLVDGSGLG